MKKINFAEITLRQEISSRGGGIEIDLTTLGFKDEKMSAYQNYLGGGMLGKICENNTINAFKKEISTKKQLKLEQIAEELKKYFHSLTNPEEGEWESVSYEQNQEMSTSAY
jgi:hypothetical protein